MTLKVSLNMEALKFAGGAIIVGAAVCIMLPDVVRYVAGLWRLGVLIVAVILLAWLLAVARLKVSRTAAKPELAEPAGARCEGGEAQPKASSGAASRADRVVLRPAGGVAQATEQPVKPAPGQQGNPRTPAKEPLKDDG